jgi:glucose/arabinose dehydrogenase
MRAVLLISIAIAQFACSEISPLPVASGMGPQPTLPPPQKSLIPTVNIAPAIGWPNGVEPVGSAGTKVAEFAGGLSHPRWLYVLPNGDVLVAETNAPPKPDDATGIRGFFMGLVMKKAGAKAESANKITLLRDTDGDGIADFRSTLLEGLSSPFGMALVNGTLYVANSDAVVKFPYTTGDTQIKTPAVTLIALPAGTINHHWTKNIIASADGKRLYASVGSNSNIAERGMQAEKDRAAIWEIDIATAQPRIFASGLRNPVGMAWTSTSTSQTLFTVVNERDELGNDLVPDYLTSVKDGGFYGWPYSYYGQNVDKRVSPEQPALVAKALSPDYALGAHTASLGLASSEGSTLSATFANGMFIGQHGSWNRKPHSGYKVIFIPFVDGKPLGEPKDVLTGFLSKDGNAYGRPVGVAINAKGQLLVADDVGNKVWSVSSLKK